VTFIIDLFFRQTWMDYRLKHNLTEHIIPLLGRRSPPSLIWTPDTVFVNAKRVLSHRVTVINDKLDIYNDGRVFWASRVTVEANCLLDLHRYPMDSQTCKLVLESYGYTTRHLTYRWRENAVNIIDPNMSQFVLLGKRNLTYDKEYEAGNYRLLEASFTFERRIAVSILQIFFPCIAITCVSWVSLWLHKNCVSARVGIGITTLLTISTIWGSLNRRLPQVSYVKAVDIFFMTSFCFIFMTLLEYTLVLNGKFRMYKNNSFKELRRKKQMRKKFGEVTTPRGILESSYIQSLKSNKDSCNSKFDDKLEENVTICELNESGKFTQYSFVQEGLDDGKEIFPKIDRDLFPYFYKVYPVTGKPSTLDVVSRFLFPFSYICFNLYFWTTYHGQHQALADESLL